VFGSTKVKVKIDMALWEKIKRYAIAAGYASPEELVVHVLDNEIAALEEADSDDEIKKKLKGLGYIS
jgi:hypothetical protein